MRLIFLRLLRFFAATLRSWFAGAGIELPGASGKKAGWAVDGKLDEG